MVRQQTIKIEQNNQLSFIYDAQVPCRFTIYFFIDETLQFFHETVKEIWPHKVFNQDQNPEIFTCQQDYELKTNQKYTTKTQINFNNRPDMAYKHRSSQNLQNYWPIVIKIEQFNPIQVMYYYCEYEKSGNENIVKFVKQRLEKDNGAYIVQEIYGIDNTELIHGQPIQDQQMNQLANEENTNKECIICFTDLIDTVILPCRHMCICMECAKSIQQQKSRAKKTCPICRKQIESFLRIQKHSNQKQQQQLEQKQ
ncbi:hypothetical protein PPERSA_03559 [Pseudocohnilembus persalinus]|uniref:RING-type domain-containing protein n=1 Tax=Pseudocohnilembus persalinus TaxID=266149 RepID=A0A0V0QPP0_PSEPJ|nr:hypothetical protein PPERSA_03559 [Pseudocohnilembus persalinus]|eukprot:KRX04319.1 hypothetical protein PPERSA_03559 [Pseudocohnilembus persalinus]